MLFCLTNSQGYYAEVLNIGATLISIVVPGRTGHAENVILRYPTIGSYINDPFYIGATIGRVANRISRAAFRMEGVRYELDKNDGGVHCNHGGTNGIHRAYFRAEIREDDLLLMYESPDGESGFPGNLRIEVTYRFTDLNELVIGHRVTTDRTTPVNLTNHAYFNLSGTGTIDHHQLKINADTYLEMQDDFIPTGRIKQVADTPFDFTTYQSLRSQMDRKKEKLTGYNTYFIQRNQEPELYPLVILRDPVSGRQVTVRTTLPGLMVYTGDYLADPFYPMQGICLETQYPPDGVNQPAFDARMLRPGETYQEQTIYQFSVLKKSG